MKPARRIKPTPYRLDDGTPLHLRSNLGEGGEGLVYDTDMGGMVAKLYLPDHPADEEKLRLLMQKSAVSRGDYDFLGNFCMPRHLVYDQTGRCVGYTMRKFNADSLAAALCQDILKERGWTRVQLARLCLGIIKSLRYLRLFNMLMGDINLRNILVAPDGEFAIIDTDSFQIERRYVCELGRPEFMSPRYIAAAARGERLRTEADENYAITTLVFHILMPEKSPFMSVDGLNRTQALKCRRFVFPEGYGNVKAMAVGTERMWYDLPQPIRAAFCGVYNDGDDVTPEQWEKLLEDYLRDMETLDVSSAIFPRSNIVPHILSLPEREGVDSAPGQYDIPRRNDSDKSDFAVVYIDCDNIWGCYCNSWERIHLRTPRIDRHRFIPGKLFDRIDTKGRIDAQALAHDLAYSKNLRGWYSSLAPRRPLVTRLYLLADSVLRNIANREEVVNAIADATGWRFNIPSLDADNETVARAMFDSLDIDWRVGKYVIYYDDRVSARLLFCDNKGLVESVVLPDCGRRVMRNRFVYTAGLERTPDTAWEEHDSACRLLADDIVIPQGFGKAQMIVAGIPSLACCQSIKKLSKRRLELDADLIPNRHRVVDYLEEFRMMTYHSDLTKDFECRLALPLIECLSRRFNCVGLRVSSLEPYQIKTIMNIQTLDP